MSNDIKKKAEKMTLSVLQAKIIETSAQCGYLTSRLAILRASPGQFESEIAAQQKNHDEACAWSSIGSAVLATRQSKEAQKQAAAAVPRKRKTAAPEVEEEEETGDTYEPEEEMGYGGPLLIAGVIATGLLGLLAARKKPMIVKYVKAIPQKVKKAVKR